MTTVAVIGSTGRVGQLVVQGALDQGYSVRALARNVSKLAEFNSRHLIVLKGDVLDKEAVGKLINGVDAVLSCLGSKPNEPEIVADGTKVVVDIIRKQTVQPRLVFLSSVGIGDSFAQLLEHGIFGVKALAFAKVMIPLVTGRQMWADLEDGEEVVRKSGVVAVIVRPTQYVTKKSRGYAVRSAEDPPPSTSIPIADVAALYVDAVETTKWDGKCISVFGK